nr:hypothetical protein Itr_chr15CG03570 [Ipomoea trifida]
MLNNLEIASGLLELGVDLLYTSMPISIIQWTSLLSIFKKEFRMTTNRINTKYWPL